MTTKKQNGPVVYHVSFVARYERSEQSERAIIAQLQVADVLVYDKTGMVHAGYVDEREQTNRRMRRAAKVLLSYSDPFDEEVCLVDFLADLQHYCKTNGYDFDHAVETARMHFEPEK